ncbi:hypothetical protein [Polyangium sp. y55x31]|uniref:hypothetical protein n=1 Tax=Polyangium sp. y55x31 TaxID=3042688 RepID=UPI0024822E6F|nr:hypothetical protein [Polyangium sp. y55x31]MDI1475408.1 hypothetical protein [Polyangium sp. y55x31]
MHAFRADAHATFIEEMMRHLTGFAPEVCKSLGGDRLREAVREGVTRAGAYGFTYRGPIRLFLESMFVLGSEFDDDPQYPWAGQALRQQDFPNQMFKAGRLEHLLRDYVTQVAGPDNALSRQALLRLEALATRSDLIFHASSSRSDILAAFGAIFPSKLRFIGQAAAEELVDRVEVMSRSVFGAYQPRALAVMAVLGFSFGVGFADDPLLPWIGAILRSEHIEDAATRALRLERSAVLRLKTVNKNLGVTHGTVALEEVRT